MSLPEVNARIKLKFCELFLRDGIQGWPSVLSTKDKLALLHLIAASGVDEIDVTSFVPAHVVPQFADSQEVLAGFEAKTEIRVLTVNLRGAQNVIETHKTVRAITTCGMPFSASEKHNIANLRCDHATHKERIAEMVDLLATAGVRPMVCVATAWGCPIDGDIDPDIVMSHVDWLYGLGVRSIMLGDTTGMADPARAGDLFSRLVSEWGEVDFIAHFHDNRGCGIANILASIDAGVRAIDGCLGGVGGEPASVEQGEVGDSGNVVSEDLIGVLIRMGFETGVNLDQLIKSGRLAEKILERRLFSKLQRSGIIDA